MKRPAIVGSVAVGLWLLLATPALAASPAGPPYPDPIQGQRVYDNAGIFSERTRSQAQAIIVGIEQRTGAQIAVYTQVKPESDSLDKANADALALMNQWGVGRKGFDDGLVILFDMQSNLRHGQVSLYAGSGYRAAFLSDGDRQAIFDMDMLPFLSAGDMEGGLMAALQAIDANATPEHQSTLERARQLNALVAVAGITLGVGLIFVAFMAWRLHGRDPVYIDDRSILMPAPPADLTPAMATLLLADRTSDRTVSAALVDLAARGCIAFEVESQIFGNTKTGLRYLGPGNGTTPDLEAALRDDVAKHSNEHKGYITAHPSSGWASLIGWPNSNEHKGYITAHRMYQLLPGFEKFKSELETTAVKRGWLTARPSQVIGKWHAIAGLEIAAAIVVGILWMATSASGLFLFIVGFAVAGIWTAFLAHYMPSRTSQGAMLWAMLSAYQRTLQLTMTQARSMNEVVTAGALPWVTTPDQAMAWAVAFGLDHEVQTVLSRSMSAALEGRGVTASATMVRPWEPAWFVTGSGAGGGAHVSSGTGGLFSASAIPDPGSIIAALRSITSASSPVSSSSGSSSSSHSSGGSFGGGGGGGGGGAGGGF